ncbi:hypothetical protein, partial [Achromobacter sp. HZ01]|uniref:hypothetical protein n=1 Tax=Achromobacter sp. HZ01 TaxID=1416886 RepID=UPI001FED663F
MSPDIELFDNGSVIDGSDGDVDGRWGLAAVVVIDEDGELVRTVVVGTWGVGVLAGGQVEVEFSVFWRL